MAVIASQSLWVRDRFLIDINVGSLRVESSQSLWVRDRFLIAKTKTAARAKHVAIPLGQGQVFNLGKILALLGKDWSQSLWVRDRFLMGAN